MTFGCDNYFRKDVAIECYEAIQGIREKGMLLGHVHGIDLGWYRSTRKHIVPRVQAKVM
jgi:hypothetical protein